MIMMEDRTLKGASLHAKVHLFRFKSTAEACLFQNQETAGACVFFLFYSGAGNINLVLLHSPDARN